MELDLELNQTATPTHPIESLAILVRLGGGGYLADHINISPACPFLVLHFFFCGNICSESN